MKACYKEVNYPLIVLMFYTLSGTTLKAFYCQFIIFYKGHIKPHFFLNLFQCREEYKECLGKDGASALKCGYERFKCNGKC